MLCFIVNEHSRSGKGAKIWKEAEAVLKKKNIAYESYVTQYEGHAFSLAHDICECGADDIQLVVVGGDGNAYRGDRAYFKLQGRLCDGSGAGELERL